jgi:5-methylcytosine-specific restriction endonuclease McrA
LPIDYSKYPRNWKTEIRPRILSRAKDKCEECGVPNRQLIYRDEKGWNLAPEGHQADAMALDGIKFVMIILTIAHLDHDIKNNEDENLKALCQRCHLRKDKHQHARNRKYGNDENQSKIEI